MPTTTYCGFISQQSASSRFSFMNVSYPRILLSTLKSGNASPWTLSVRNFALVSELSNQLYGVVTLASASDFSLAIVFDVAAEFASEDIAPQVSVVIPVVFAIEFISLSVETPLKIWRSNSSESAACKS